MWTWPLLPAMDLLTQILPSRGRQGGKIAKAAPGRKQKERREEKQNTLRLFSLRALPAGNWPIQTWTPALGESLPLYPKSPCERAGDRSIRWESPKESWTLFSQRSTLLFYIIKLMIPVSKLPLVCSSHLFKINFYWSIIAIQCCVSAVQQSESAVRIHISPFFGFPSHLGHHRALSRVPCAIGEGNGTPLQYSCLENPMDGGAW